MILYIIGLFSMFLICVGLAYSSFIIRRYVGIEESKKTFVKRDIDSASVDSRLVKVVVIIMMVVLTVYFISKDAIIWLYKKTFRRERDNGAGHE